jgi:hypothetical protein
LVAVSVELFSSMTKARSKCGQSITWMQDVHLPEVLRTAQATMAGGLCGANWKKGDDYAA